NEKFHYRHPPPCRRKDPARRPHAPPRPSRKKQKKKKAPLPAPAGTDAFKRPESAVSAGDQLLDVAQLAEPVRDDEKIEHEEQKQADRGESEGELVALFFPEQPDDAPQNQRRKRENEQVEHVEAGCLYRRLFCQQHVRQTP